MNQIAFTTRSSVDPFKHSLKHLDWKKIGTVVSKIFIVALTISAIVAGGVFSGLAGFAVAFSIANLAFSMISLGCVITLISVPINISSFQMLKYTNDNLKNMKEFIFATICLTVFCVVAVFAHPFMSPNR